MLKLQEFIKQFTKVDILKDIHIKEIEHRFYAAEPSAYMHPPTYEGIYLGEMVKNRFKPSFILLDMIKDQTDNTIIVDDKQAWLFLCGRDILKAKDHKVKDSSIVLVLNLHDEVLGYGVYWQEGKVTVKNLLDRGDFLRRER